MTEQFGNYRILGKKMARVDARLKATGQARYAGDLERPDMLWCRVKRCPHPHARILNIDTTKAEKLPGVKGVITGKDFNGFRWGWSRDTRDEDPLAVEKVRYLDEGGTLATYADLEQVPEPLVAEIIDGELVTSPRPRIRHALAHSVIGTDLVGPFGHGGGRAGPGGWWILDEPELHLGRLRGRPDPRDEVLVPDLAGWRRERLPTLPDVQGIELAPDWVCEILSPSTARIDRIKKMRIYGEVGVEHVWLVDVDQRTLEVYRRVQGLLALAGGFEDRAVVRAEPFEAVPIDLGGWWGQT